MFSDFDKTKEPKEGRGRMGASLGIAALVFLLLGGALATAIATARAVVRRERDLDVEFAALPPPAPEPIIELPPPPPPPPRVARPRRPGAARPNLGPPKEIPDEQPEEAEGDLGDAGDVGPIDNDAVVGGEGGTGPALPTMPAPPTPPPGPPTPPRPEPEQIRETVSAPRFLSGCRMPETPAGLSTQAATIRIEVRILVGTDGTVTNATIVSPSPLVPDELVLGCVRQQVFEPAHLPDGTAVPYPLRRRFVFRPDSL